MCCKSATSSRLDHLGFGGGLALNFDADQRFYMFPMLTVISRDTSISLYLPLRESIVEQPSNLLNPRRFDRPQGLRLLTYFYKLKGELHTAESLEPVSLDFEAIGNHRFVQELEKGPGRLSSLPDRKRARFQIKPYPGHMRTPAILVTLSH